MTRRKRSTFKRGRREYKLKRATYKPLFIDYGMKSFEQMIAVVYKRNRMKWQN